MRCPCTACVLHAALVLLRTGRLRMAVVLLEQAVQAAEQEQALALAAEETRAKPRARRGRRARP